MNKSLLFTIIILLSIACKENNDNIESYSFDFKPRKCNIVSLLSMKQTATEYNGITYFEYLSIEENTKIKSSIYVIGIWAANGFDRFVIDDPIPSLEKEISIDYEKYLNKSYLPSKSNLLQDTDFELATTIHEIEYRLDGIVNFNISSLDAPLFSKPIGSSLNQYFEIFKYNPDFIASYDSKRLLYGYTDKEKPNAIDEWLSLRPMAQSSMYVRLKSIPDNLPVTLRFKVDMETTNGIIVSDTTDVVTLSN
jgi:hypothetical protein